MSSERPHYFSRLSSRALTRSELMDRMASMVTLGSESGDFDVLEVNPTGESFDIDTSIFDNVPPIEAEGEGVWYHRSPSDPEPSVAPPAEDFSVGPTALAELRERIRQSRQGPMPLNMDVDESMDHIPATERNQDMKTFAENCLAGKVLVGEEVDELRKELADGKATLAAERADWEQKKRQFASLKRVIEKELVDVKATLAAERAHWGQKTRQFANFKRDIEKELTDTKIELEAEQKQHAAELENWATQKIFAQQKFDRYRARAAERESSLIEEATSAGNRAFAVTAKMEQKNAELEVVRQEYEALRTMSYSDMPHEERISPLQRTASNIDNSDESMLRLGFGPGPSTNPSVLQSHKGKGRDMGVSQNPSVNEYPEDMSNDDLRQMIDDESLADFGNESSEGAFDFAEDAGEVDQPRGTMYPSPPPPPENQAQLPSGAVTGSGTSGELPETNPANRPVPSSGPSTRRPTLFKESGSIPAFPSRMVPLPAGLTYEQIIDNFPNHLVGPVILDLFDNSGYTYNEIARRINSQGKGHITPDTLWKRMKVEMVKQGRDPENERNTIKGRRPDIKRRRRNWEALSLPLEILPSLSIPGSQE